MSFSYRAGTSARCAGGTGTTGHNSPLSPTIPSGLSIGDFMVLSYTSDSNTADPGGQGTINSPSGWTALSAQLSTSGAICRSWYKVAVSGDLVTGPTVDYGTTTVGSGAKAACTWDSWTGNDTTTPVDVSASSSSSTGSASHVMPTVDTTGKGTDLIISIMLDREATESASYSASSGWNIRNSSLGTAGATGGNPGICVVDSGTPVSPGTGQGGGTITGGQSASALFGYTLALAPSGTSQTARPTVDVTTSGWTTSSVLGGGVQDCSLLADDNDATYVQSPTAPTASVFEAKLATMSAPPDQFRVRGYFSGGASTGTIVSKLMQGTTTIATRTDTFASSPPTAATDFIHALSSGEKSAISDLTDLRVRATVTAA